MHELPSHEISAYVDHQLKGVTNKALVPRKLLSAELSEDLETSLIQALTSWLSVPT